MNFLKLHNHDGNEVYVNLEKVYAIEPYKYGIARLTRLYMSDYCHSVLETPDEIFGADRGKDVPPSVIYTRSCIYKKELKEMKRKENASWYPWKNGDEQRETGEVAE